MKFPDEFAFPESNISKMYVCSLDAFSLSNGQFNNAKIPTIYVRKKYQGSDFMGKSIERMTNDSICYYNRPKATEEVYYFRLVASFFSAAFFPALLQDRVFISMI